jgi:hypothetical protein
MNKVLGRFLRWGRRGKRLQLADVAQQLQASHEFSERDILDIEAGRVSPPAYYFIAMLRLYGFSDFEISKLFNNFRARFQRHHGAREAEL